MGASRKNKAVKTLKFDETWQNVDLDLEVAKKQKCVIHNGLLVMLGDDLRKVVTLNMATGAKTEVPLAYQRKDKLDDKKPRRESYGLGEWVEQEVEFNGT